jgi:hypothetical protein
MAATDQGIAHQTVWEKFSISLPHPYLTRYHAEPISKDGSESAYRISLASPEEQSQNEPPFLLHSSDLSFSSLAQGHDITIADNTAWARARRSPSTTFAWTSVAPPKIAQLWLLVYSCFTVHYSEEAIRLDLVGTQAALVRDELIAVGLAIPHPAAIDSPGAKETSTVLLENEILLLRSSFWQGAGSPFGPRPVWLPVNDNSSRQPLHTFPLLPATQIITTKFPSARVHTLHPVRPAKPTPGSLIYSRYIPHLDEHFSMVALDYKDPEHLNLFHIWQNDPRVAAGWNESGTIEHHTKYLKDLHEDPHVLTILAKFDDTPFAYFEVYWGKVSSYLLALYL